MKQILSNKLILILYVVGTVVFAGKVNAQTYCTPTYFQGCLTNVEINDFSLIGDAGTSISDLATGCSSVGSFPPITCYRDMHTSMSVTLSPSTTYTVVATAPAADILPTGMQIFIDFNDNGSFLDAGESVGGGAFALLGLSTNFVITIPAGVPTGTHRMRAVASGDLTYPSIIPCPSYSLTGGGTSLTGEVHDYSVVIGTVTTVCNIPTSLTATAVTSTSAVINWIEPSGSIGSEYVVTTTAGTPTSAGTGTSSLTYSATGLTPSTVYYASVRDSCDASTLSAWVTITFTTTPTCGVVTGLTASPIASHSATISWTAVVGSIGYIYLVNTTATSPTSGGTFTTATNAFITGLTPSTNYYAHVRDSCGAGSESGWVNIPFTTLASGVGVNNINEVDFSINTYPNPIKDEVNIVVIQGAEEIGQVQLFDISGKLIKTDFTNLGMLNLSLKNYPNGVYLVRYIDALNTQTIKIIKH